jgi:hypothetical protein
VKFKLLLLLLALALQLSACGKSRTKTASDAAELADGYISVMNLPINSQFLDAPVRGLNVVLEDGTMATTGFNGSFRCVTGQMVTFKLGNLVLGRATCSDKMFITEITQGNFRRAVGLGFILQTIGVTTPYQIDVSLYSDQNFTKVEAAMKIFLKSSGHTDALAPLITAFTEAGFPGFESYISRPQKAYDVSRAHIAYTFTKTTDVPAWTITPRGNVEFVGTLNLDEAASNSEDCSEKTILSSVIEFDYQIGYYKYRYQVIEQKNKKNILHSSDDLIKYVSQRSSIPHYETTNSDNAFVLTGNKLNASFSSSLGTKTINILNSLKFEGFDLETLTLIGVVGSVSFDGDKVVGCLYKVNLEGHFIPNP